MDLVKTFRDWQRRNYFRELVFQGDVANLSDKTAPRLVVLVRDDLLPPIHQGIQAAHAIVSLSNQVVSHLDARSYIILLGASESQILDACQKFPKKYALYHDPGLIDPTEGDPLLTACAFEPISNAQVKKFFGHLKRAE